MTGVVRNSELCVLVVGLLLCFFLAVGAQITDPSEVDALRAIRRNLVDSGNLLGNWERGDPCVQNWTGIVCSDVPLEDGYLHIQELHLMRMNLSGTIAPEVGNLFRLKILDLMWNAISGGIPREIGRISTLELLLVNGNNLTGSLPEELGYLPNLDRLQIDQNSISGPVPPSFANLNKTRHFHMNNNSISGQIPPELSRLPSLIHLLLDNNNLSGFLPPEFSEFPRLRILQLDNNNFEGSEIPASFRNMTRLLKLSLRNCSLQGPVPNFSLIPRLSYIDLSWNRLSGSIATGNLSSNITTIDLSRNQLNGSIPSSFLELPFLQRLSLENNSLSGTVSSSIWENVIISSNKTIVLNLENNLFSNVSGRLNPPSNVSLLLQGNPVCNRANDLSITQLCGFQEFGDKPETLRPETGCHVNACPVEQNYGYVRGSPDQCFCASPLRVGYRLKSPMFSSFPPYVTRFEVYLATSLQLALYQLQIDSFMWEEGPRLKMDLRLFPPFYNESDKFSQLFNVTEIRRIRGMFTKWTITADDFFGPHELLNFTLLPPYQTDLFGSDSSESGLKAGAVAGIVLAVTALILSFFTLMILLLIRCCRRRKNRKIRKSKAAKMLTISSGIKDYSFKEMEVATNKFSSSTKVGFGGYGNVYRGILSDGTVVAIKRAREGSRQGEREFYTEIQLLSRLHHRNLVSLLGYCDDRGEQMLVYEFMHNGTVHDLLSSSKSEGASFASRLKIALGSAKGIRYLHTEADPPIFHRDIKSNNILLDSKWTPKVADFGISKQAPVVDGVGTVPGPLSTNVKGSVGYLDPEYVQNDKFTDRSDVYSLGVVFLELLTGKRPISLGVNIVQEVYTAYQSGMLLSVIDDRMGSQSLLCIEQFLKLALSCCQEKGEGRPSMADVVRELENIWHNLSDSEKLQTASSMPVPRQRSSDLYPSSSTFDSSFPTDVSSSNLVSGVIPTIRPL